MNTRDLTTIVHNTDPNISWLVSSAIVTALFAGITNGLARGEDIRIPGFGSFAVAQRAAGEDRNPGAGEPVKIPAKRVPRFRPAQALKEAVNPLPKVGGARYSPMRQAG